MQASTFVAATTRRPSSDASLAHRTWSGPVKSVGPGPIRSRGEIVASSQMRHARPWATGGIIVIDRGWRTPIGHKGSRLVSRPKPSTDDERSRAVTPLLFCSNAMSSVQKMHRHSSLSGSLKQHGFQHRLRNGYVRPAAHARQAGHARAHLARISVIAGGCACARVSPANTPNGPGERVRSPPPRRPFSRRCPPDIRSSVEPRD